MLIIPCKFISGGLGGIDSDNIEIVLTHHYTN